MSTLKDIVDTLMDFKGEVVPYVQSGKGYGTLSKASQSSILNFPVIVSNTISIEDASLVNKALEKEFASFLLTVTTMNPYLFGSNERELSANAYVKKFHQNMDRRFDSTDVANILTSSSTESVEVDGYEFAPDTNDEISYKVYENMNIPEFNAYNSKFSRSVEDMANPTILNNLGKRSVLEANLDDIPPLPPAGTVGGPRHNNDRDRYATNNGVGAYSLKDVKLLMDNDAKKANELVPTLLHIRIFPVKSGSNGREMMPMEVVLGVKATLHPVDSEEMTTNIARGIKNENIFFNFIRWTTGEIKFFKDFLFTMNELKIDAMNDGKRSSRWWTMLKRRRSLAKIKNKFSKDKFMPNATIVITQEEVNVLRDAYGYDLNQTNMAYQLMHNYFLIAFVIVDPALQRVKFLFDGRNEFETLTYATLAKESTTNDRQFQQMLSMMGRRL